LRDDREKARVAGEMRVCLIDVWLESFDAGWEFISIEPFGVNREGLEAAETLSLVSHHE
jgi:hypothetical protein